MEAKITVELWESDPNTKKFKRTLILYDTDTQYASVFGNPLCQATKCNLWESDIQAGPFCDQEQVNTSKMTQNEHF